MNQPSQPVSFETNPRFFGAPALGMIPLVAPLRFHLRRPDFPVLYSRQVFESAESASHQHMFQRASAVIQPATNISFGERRPLFSQRPTYPSKSSRYSVSHQHIPFSGLRDKFSNQPSQPVSFETNSRVPPVVFTPRSPLQSHLRQVF